MDCHPATTPRVFCCCVFHRQGFISLSHLHSLGQRWAGSSVTLGWQWCPACPTDSRQDPVRPFDTCQPPGWGGAVWFSAVAVFAVAGISQWALPHSKILWDKILHQHPALWTPGTRVGSTTTAPTFILCGRAPWHPPTRSCGESKEGTALLLLCSPRSPGSNSYLHRSRGMLCHSASVLRGTSHQNDCEEHSSVLPLLKDRAHE